MKALSIRQPWAFHIFHSGKDIENRAWPTRFRGRVLIHAAKGMTRAEFAEGTHPLVLPAGNVKFPLWADLQRGGIVGSVEIVDCVTQSESGWFFGPYGFVLRDPQVLPFRPLKGALGFFEVPDEPH